MRARPSGFGHRLLRSGCVWFLGFLAAIGPAVAAGEAGTVPAEAPRALTVRPGAVVRWTGGQATGCGMAEERWAPIADSCWYPVDLLAEGTVEARRWVSDGGHQPGHEPGHERQETALLRVGDYPYPVQRLEIADDGKVHLSAANEARAQRESARVEALWARRTPRRFTLPLAAPLAKLPAEGRFGSRRFFNGEPRSPHTGADYAAVTGTPVLAVAPGRVMLAEEHFFSGNSVFIDHGDGLISMSFHLSTIAVAPGDEVTAGQEIGRVGATGRVTGPHLHFGLRWRGARVDPAVLLGPATAVPTLAPTPTA